MANLISPKTQSCRQQLQCVGGASEDAPSLASVSVHSVGISETVSRREKCDICSQGFHWARPSWHSGDGISMFFWFTFPWWVTVLQTSIFHMLAGHLYLLLLELSVWTIYPLIDWISWGKKAWCLTFWVLYVVIVWILIPSHMINWKAPPPSLSLKL